MHAHREHCKPWCLLYFALLYTSWWDRSNLKLFPRNQSTLQCPSFSGAWCFSVSAVNMRRAVHRATERTQREPGAQPTTSSKRGPNQIDWYILTEYNTIRLKTSKIIGSRNRKAVNSGGPWFATGSSPKIYSSTRWISQFTARWHLVLETPSKQRNRFRAYHFRLVLKQWVA